MRTDSIIHNYMEHTALVVENSWCEECYVDHLGPCPSEGEVDCPNCYRYPDYKMLMSVVEECYDKFAELL